MEAVAAVMAGPAGLTLAGTGAAAASLAQTGGKVLVAGGRFPFLPCRRAGWKLPGWCWPAPGRREWAARFRSCYAGAG